MALYLEIGRLLGSQHGKDEVVGSSPTVGSTFFATELASAGGW